MIDIQQLHLRDEIPENLLKDEKVVRLADALSVPIQKASTWAHKLNYTINVRDLPEEIIDHLLWEMHIGPNEGLLLANTFDAKVNLLESAIELHRKKGTPYAIELVLKAINLDGEVLEWFQYDGEPFFFRVEVDSTHVKRETVRLLRDMILEYKNTRSWLDHIVIRITQTQYIELESDQYQYPVYLPICGTFHCEGIPGKIQEKTMELQKVNYTYPVYLPICGEIYPNEVMDEW